MATFGGTNSGLLLYLSAIECNLVRGLWISKPPGASLSFNSVYRKVPRIPATAPNSATRLRTRWRLLWGADTSLNHTIGRFFNGRHGTQACGWSSEPGSLCSSRIIIYGARVGSSFPGTPLLACQQGQVEILGELHPKGAYNASLSHMVSIGGSKSCLSGSDNMLTVPASMHAQVSGLVDGVRERLRFTATSLVCAHERFISV